MTTSTVPPAPTAASTTTPYRVHIRRVLQAPRARVFEAWTKPEQMQKWRSPAGWTVPEIEADVRPGGAYRILMRGTVRPSHPDEQPQEREGYFSGVFLDIVPNELVRFTSRANWMPEQETIVTVRLSDAEDGGTLLEFTDENFLAAETAANHTTGWNASFDKLVVLLAKTA